MYRLVLIDDHHIVREGFKHLFEGHSQLQVVGEASTPEEGLRVCMSLRPDLIMLDLSLGSARSGMQLLPQLVTNCPHSKVVIVSMHDDPALVVRALTEGARGFINKVDAPDLLIKNLLRILDGEIVTDMLSNTANHPKFDLSDRDRAIIRGIVAEKQPKVIAFELDVSDKTLYRQRANLFEKLGVRTNGDVIRLARERGWLVD